MKRFVHTRKKNFIRPTNLFVLFGLAIATSIDALAVGLSFSLLDHWIAFGLLIIIGCRMIYEAFCSHQEKKTHTPNKSVRIVWARHCHQHRRTCCGIKFFIAGHTDLFTSTFDRCGDICSFVLRSYDGQITGSKMGRKSTRFWRNCIDPNRY